MSGLSNAEYGIEIHIYNNRASELVLSRKGLEKLLENNNSQSFTINLE